MTFAFTTKAIDMTGIKKSRASGKLSAIEREKKRQSGNIDNLHMDQDREIETFRLVDLPKELRRRFSKMAFDPIGQELHFRIFENVCSVTPRMPYIGRKRQPPPLLFVNKKIFQEAIDLFHEKAEFDVRCFADWSNEDGSWDHATNKLRVIQECQIFGNIKSLFLQVKIDNVTGMDAYVRGLRQLVKALHYGNQLKTLDATLFANSEADDCVKSEKVGYILAPLANFACQGSVQVGWFDGAGTEDFQLVTWKFGIMAFELKENIMLSVMKTPLQMPKLTSCRNGEVL